MKYRGSAGFTHEATPCTGVLLLNLGTPDAPNTGAVRRYLAQFLSDPRVIEAPRWLWSIVLHGVILRLRPRRSAAAYRKVWTEEGSPLLVNSQRQADALTGRLRDRYGEQLQVALGMRYGQPSIESALRRLHSQGMRKLVVLPLYPQYSGSTTGSTFEAVAAELSTWRWIPELRFVTQYHDHSEYIAALATSVREHWQVNGRAERLLFSFHGLPRRYLDAGDPYHCQCHKTARLVAQALELADTQWFVSFQSRVGREEWLRPYTDETLAAWGREEAGAVQVVCPGFSADCLETLEEIAMQNKSLYRSAGGGELQYIPALNDRADHIDALESMLCENLDGWANARQPDRTEAKESAARARALGAAS